MLFPDIIRLNLPIFSVAGIKWLAEKRRAEGINLRLLSLRNMDQSTQLDLFIFSPFFRRSLFTACLASLAELEN